MYWSTVDSNHVSYVFSNLDFIFDNPLSPNIERRDDQTVVSRIIEGKGSQFFTNERKFITG